MDDIIIEVLDEVKRAEALYSWWPDDPLHAVCIVSEECGELVRACNRYFFGETYNEDEMKVEAIQTAAMAIRFLKGIGEKQ